MYKFNTFYFHINQNSYYFKVGGTFIYSNPFLMRFQKAFVYICFTYHFIFINTMLKQHICYYLLICTFSSLFYLMTISLKKLEHRLKIEFTIRVFMCFFW